MTIWRKTGYSIGITVAVVSLLLYGTLQLILRNGLKKIEMDLSDCFISVESAEVCRNVARVIDAFEVQRSALEVKASDWAQWDDTYRFAVDGNGSSRMFNCTVSTLKLLEINCVAILDRKGKCIFSLFVDGDSSYIDDVSVIIKQYSAMKTVAARNKKISGIVIFNGMPMLIAGLPIKKNDGSGLMKGTCIFGKYIDDAFIADLASVTHLKLESDTKCTMHDLNNTIVKCTSSVMVNVKTDTLIGSQIVFDDIDNQSAVFVTMYMKREVYKNSQKILHNIQKRGKMTAVYFVVSVLITGAVLCCVIFIILELSVLRRVRKLERKSSEIAKVGFAGKRLPVDGNDEITTLTERINSMLDALEHSHLDIVLRDHEIRLLMNSVPAGVCSLNESLIINPEYSKKLETMFGLNECAGHTIMELLALENEGDDMYSDLLSYLDLVKRNIVSEKELFELNPIKQYHFIHRSTDAWYEIRFYSMNTKGANSLSILVIVTDITEEKLLSFKNEDIQRENIQLRHIAENPEFFIEFVHESSEIIKKVSDAADAVIPGDTNITVINTMFRGIHTIKGVAGSFGLRKIDSEAEMLEDLLGAMLDQDNIGSTEVETLHSHLKVLGDVITDIVSMSSELFGFICNKEGTLVNISVDSINSAIGDLKEVQKHMLHDNNQVSVLCDTVYKRIVAMKEVPAGRVFSRSLRMIPMLCERLHKNCVVEFYGKDVTLDYEIAQKINMLLVHLLRNAIDHGIEYTEEREKKNKKPKGTIILSIKKEPGSLSVELSDDGAGIDPDAIRNALEKNGFTNRENAERVTGKNILDMIFTSGFTTLDRMSEVSGRGVGLDMVADTVRNELHGTITVSSEVGKGTLFSMLIPIK